MVRGGASPEKVGWKRDGIDGQKVYLTILMSFLLRNEYPPQSTPWRRPWIWSDIGEFSKLRGAFA